MNTYRAEILQKQGGAGSVLALYIKAESKDSATQYFRQLILANDERILIEEVPWAGY